MGHHVLVAFDSFTSALTFQQQMENSEIAIFKHSILREVLLNVQKQRLASVLDIQGADAAIRSFSAQLGSPKSMRTLKSATSSTINQENLRPRFM